MYFISTMGELDETSTPSVYQAEKGAHWVRLRRGLEKRPELVLVIEAEDVADARRQSNEYFAELEDRDNSERRTT